MKDPKTRSNIFILLMLGALFLILLLVVNKCENVSIRSQNPESVSVIETVHQEKEKV